MFFWRLPFEKCYKIIIIFFVNFIHSGKLSASNFGQIFPKNENRIGHMSMIFVDMKKILTVEGNAKYYTE